MIPRPSRRIARLALAACLAVATGSTLVGDTDAATAASGQARTTIIFGMVSDNPKKHYPRLKPIVDYIASRMGDLGITEGKVLLARDNRQMVRYLRQGKVDWISETPFSAVEFADRAGARVLARRWKKGVAEYYTVFFARRDSGIRTLEDLEGSVIAFEDPGSTSAYFMPSAELLHAGVELVELDSPRDEPVPGAVGFVFSGEEINTATWVHKGLVDAGAFSNLDWEKTDKMPAEFREDMEVFHSTTAVPRALELVRGDLDETLVARLEELLIGAADDPEAQEALSAYQKTTRFDRVNPEILAGLDAARELREVVRAAVDD